MITNFEFLGEEPIENVITCMHYRIDKVVYFGYHETIQALKGTTESFLRKYCGVKKVVFIALSHKNLASVVETMRTEINKEISNNNQIYFDITGGESLILVAFGRLSKEFDTPIHIFDVEADEVVEIEEGAKRQISKDVPVKRVKMDLDRYIELRGGTINYRLQKDIKGKGGKEFEEDVAKMWEVARENVEYWNPFSSFIRKYFAPVDELQVSKRAGTIVEALNNNEGKLKTVRKLNQIIDSLAERKLLLDVVHADGKYRFRYKNQLIKDCLWDGGSILELHTYQQERKESDDCRVGVHLDWDGVIHEQYGEDVLNEIDVLTLRGNIPTFISCKSGKLTPTQALHALYELDTVARRFGGKYVEKVLVTANGIGSVYMERAAEMRIEVR